MNVENINYQANNYTIMYVLFRINIYGQVSNYLESFRDEFNKLKFH